MKEKLNPRILLWDEEIITNFLVWDGDEVELDIFDIMKMLQHWRDQWHKKFTIQLNKDK